MVPSPPAVHPPEKRSFGTRLIETLGKQLKGDVQLTSTSVCDFVGDISWYLGIAGRIKSWRRSPAAFAKTPLCAHSASSHRLERRPRSSAGKKPERLSVSLRERLPCRVRLSDV
jgi:hypothetical protein